MWHRAASLKIYLGPFFFSLKLCRLLVGCWCKRWCASCVSVGGKSVKPMLEAFNVNGKVAAHARSKAVALSISDRRAMILFVTVGGL
jgi:hypothetical protein